MGTALRTAHPAPATTDIPVGLGRMEVSARPGDVLCAIGLGSCIGLVMVDPRAGVAGLAHVMLPTARDARPELPGKYADTAVPALLAAVLALGADRRGLIVKAAGGAQMFANGSGARTMAIGDRNDEAVRAALAQAGLHLRAADIGGARGRTLRVDVATGRVTVRTVGGPEERL